MPNYVNKQGSLSATYFSDTQALYVTQSPIIH